MREVYPDLMPAPTDQRSLDFGRSTIVLDTNVLLGLYRYSKKTSKRFLDLLDRSADRLWMPHQVGWEFLRRRPGVRLSLTDHHDKRIKSLEALQNTFTQNQKQSHIVRGMEEDRFLEALKTYRDYLEAERVELIAWSKNTSDDILSELDRLYSGDNVGAKPSPEWYSAHSKNGENRYKSMTPPGFEDSSKETNKYGDYFLWAQMLEEAGKRKQPFVFVTADRKADWWEIYDKQYIGPRWELLEEFHQVTGQSLQIYDTPSFFEHLEDLVFPVENGEPNEAQDEIAAWDREGVDVSVSFAQPKFTPDPELSATVSDYLVKLLQNARSDGAWDTVVTLTDSPQRDRTKRQLLQRMINQEAYPDDATDTKEGWAGQDYKDTDES